MLSSGSRFGKNVIFGADMSSFMHIDNKKKDISILGKGSNSRVGHDNTTLAAEKECSINFNEQQNEFLLNMHFNGGE